jgi:hypothetical protein
MILDNLLLFTGTSNGASGVPALDSLHDRPTTGTQASSNILDLAQGQTNLTGALPLSQAQAAGPPATTAQPFRDLGIGDDPAMKILVVVTTALTGGTNITLSLQGAPDSGTGTPGAFTSWWTSPTYTTAQLITGSRLMDMDMPRPPLGSPEPRYLQLQYVSTGTYTAGAILAGLVVDRHDQIYNNAGINSLLGGYPAGITVPN